MRIIYRNAKYIDLDLSNKVICNGHIQKQNKEELKSNSEYIKLMELLSR